jgi:hypothetical protein
MGSSGTGNFSDYSGSGGGQQQGGGGKLPNDPCTGDLGSIRLEEVANSHYYQNANAVPAADESVSLLSAPVAGRLAVQSDVNGQIIGLLPTRFNYVLGCLERGFSYSGHVEGSNVSPLPDVVVRLFAR